MGKHQSSSITSKREKKTTGGQAGGGGAGKVENEKTIAITTTPANRSVIDKPLLSPRRSGKRRVSIELNVSGKSDADNNSRLLTNKKVSKSKSASLKEIPRFYFPRGKP